MRGYRWSLVFGEWCVFNKEWEGGGMLEGEGVRE